MDEIKEVEVSNCVRCNGTHKVKFHLSKNRHYEIGDDDYQYWGMCPDTDEPILMSVAKREDLSEQCRAHTASVDHFLPSYQDLKAKYYDALSKLDAALTNNMILHEEIGKLKNPHLQYCQPMNKYPKEHREEKDA